MSPAVLRLLKSTIAACRRAGKPVSLCGEMASSPRGFLLLFGMGLRSFGMSPTFIPSMKELVGRLTEERAQAALDRVLRMKTVRQVVRFMDRELQDLSPEAALLETT